MGVKWKTEGGKPGTDDSRSGAGQCNGEVSVRATEEGVKTKGLQTFIPARIGATGDQGGGRGADARSSGCHEVGGGSASLAWFIASGNSRRSKSLKNAV